jgi:CHAD domain-containing protein
MTATNSWVENEVKLAPKPRLQLHGLPGEPLETRHFLSTYYDSEDGLLDRLGITLRRRVEHGKSLWQLKLPRARARLEVERPGGPAAPPGRIDNLLGAVLRGRELHPIAELKTVRHGVRLRSDAATADIVLDEVAVMDHLRVRSTFEELEIELLEGEVADLRRIEKLVRRAGAGDGDPRPKVLRALGRDGRQSPDRPQLQAFFREQYERILAHDPGVRIGDDPEDLHDLRVAVRRLRAILKVAAPPLDREWAEGLRSELDWLGQALGPVRDLDVLIEHLRAEQHTLSEDELSFSAVLTQLATERIRARRRLLSAMRSGRYLRLLDRLEGAARRPVTRSARPRADDVAADAFSQARKAVGKLGSDPSDRALHKARIRVKRARYAAELASPGARKRVAKLIEAAKDFQDVTGDHQDTVVAVEHLRGIAGTSSPATAFAAGRIAEREHSRRQQLRADLPAAWKRLKTRGSRAWR